TVRASEQTGRPLPADAVVRTIPSTPPGCEMAAQKRNDDGPNRVLREPLAVRRSCEAVLDLAAPRGERERSAHLAHSLDGQTGDPSVEQLLGDESEVVERERALVGHSVVCVEYDLSRDLSDRPGRGYCA